jgi:hypothetical protein
VGEDRLPHFDFCVKRRLRLWFGIGIDEALLGLPSRNAGFPDFLKRLFLLVSRIKEASQEFSNTLSTLKNVA